MEITPSFFSTDPEQLRTTGITHGSITKPSAAEIGAGAVVQLYSYCVACGFRQCRGYSM